MKILALTRYSRDGASSRLRFLQYVPYLESQGLRISASPLLDSAYLQRLYQGRSTSLAGLVRAYSARFRQLLKAGEFDVLWIEKELFPMLGATAEQALSLRETPFVVDYDDAIFHNYDLSGNKIVRTLLGKKIDKVMRAASAVVVGNGYLAARAKESGARRVEILPTVVDLVNYAVKPRPPSEEFTIGWIGTPKTAKYLHLVSAALRELSIRGRIVVRLVGSGPVELPGVSVETRAWTESNEAMDVGSFDVGIMPLPDDPWERGKCGYKLIQYMACGRPVIASPVGANKSIVKDGVNGFLADGNEQWFSALLTLFEQPAVRSSMGAAARKTVEAQYSLQVTGPRLLSLLQDLVSAR